VDAASVSWVRQRPVELMGLEPETPACRALVVIGVAMCGNCAYTAAMATRAETRDERLHLRLSPTDDGLIRAAAEAAHLSITEFVVQAARASAAETLADRDHVVLDAKTWDALERRVSRKGRRNAKTAELFERSSPFER
jgi:uncharacterized protein (DUF1778 family)